MKSPIRLLWLALVLGPAFDASAQVWRCETDGRVLFSDRPCADGGRVIDSRQLNANLLQPAAVAVLPQALPSAGTRAVSLAVGSACSRNSFGARHWAP